MQGLSSRSSLLTPRQIQISSEISEAVTELPIALADLISEMATPDFSLAAQSLEFHQIGAVIESPRNREIISCIEQALTTPSSECDPAIKSAIFQNANQTGHSLLTHGILKPYLAKIINDLRFRDQQINLDEVVIKGTAMFYLNGVDLSGISARFARFENVILDHLELSKADFTGATFVNVSMKQTNLSKANVVNASFIGVDFRETRASELTGNQSAIFRRAQTSSPARSLPKEPGRRIINTVLSGSGITAMADRKNFTLPARIMQRPIHISSDKL